MNTTRFLLRWQILLVILVAGIGLALSRFLASPLQQAIIGKVAIFSGAGFSVYWLLWYQQRVRIRRERIIWLQLVCAIVAIAFGQLLLPYISFSLHLPLIICGFLFLWVAMRQRTGDLSRDLVGKVLLLWDGGMILVMTGMYIFAPEYRLFVNAVRMDYPSFHSLAVLALIVVVTFLLIQLTVLLSRQIPSVLKGPRGLFTLGALLLSGCELNLLAFWNARYCIPSGTESILLALGLCFIAISAHWEIANRGRLTMQVSANVLPAKLSVLIPGLSVFVLLGSFSSRVLLTPALLAVPRFTGYHLGSLICVLFLIIGRYLLSMEYMNNLLQKVQDRYIEAALRAATDSLTELANYRSFMDQLRLEMRRASRYQRPLTLIFCDLDHFKVINDTHGHLIGDKALRAVAGCLKSAVRETDRCARYGGEEFVLLLPETTLADGVIIAERLRLQIADILVPVRHESSVSLTVSCGISAYSETCDSLQSLLDTADQAMYEAKRKGRNCVELAHVLPANPARQVQPEFGTSVGRA